MKVLFRKLNFFPPVLCSNYIQMSNQVSQPLDHLDGHVRSIKCSICCLEVLIHWANFLSCDFCHTILSSVLSTDYCPAFELCMLCSHFLKLSWADFCHSNFLSDFLSSDFLSSDFLSSDCCLAFESTFSTQIPRASDLSNSLL